MSKENHKDPIYLIDSRGPQPGPVRVHKVWSDIGSMEPLKCYTEEVNHSPDGFNIGYNGSGPSQLAYAMCRDYLGDKASDKCRAMQVYQHVCKTLIAGIPTGSVVAVTGQMLNHCILGATEQKRK